MKKKVIIYMYFAIFVTSCVISLETNEKKNALLLKDIKNKVVKDMVRLFDSNFEVLRGFNEIKYKQENIENLPNKYLNKLHVTNSLYTNKFVSKNLKSKLMKVKSLNTPNIDNKIAKIDSTNNLLILNDSVELSKINNDASRKREELSGLTNLFDKIIHLPNFQKRMNYIIDNNPELISTDDSKDKVTLKLKQSKEKKSSYKEEKPLHKRKKNIESDIVRSKGKKNQHNENLDKLVNQFNDELIKDNIALKNSKI